jgi:hypothetical protein
VARISYAKVAEFQRRGIVHLHSIIRLDGPATATEAYPAPIVPVDTAQLADLIRAAGARVYFDAPPVDPNDKTRRLRFGDQLDTRPITLDADREGDGELCPERVAAYIAKYATKACEDFGMPSRISGPESARRLGVGEHAVRIIAAAAEIAQAKDYAGVGRWLHMLGFRGHFATKSRRYSTTLGRLRTARRRWQLAQLRARRGGPPIDPSWDAERDDDETTLVLGTWTFAGVGWQSAGDAALAAQSAALAREYADQRRQHRNDKKLPASRLLPASR